MWWIRSDDAGESKYVDAINKNIQLERRATWVGNIFRGFYFGTCITHMSAEVACPSHFNQNGKNISLYASRALEKE